MEFQRARLHVNEPLCSFSSCCTIRCANPSANWIDFSKRNKTQKMTSTSTDEWAETENATFLEIARWRRWLAAMLWWCSSIKTICIMLLLTNKNRNSRICVRPQETQRLGREVEKQHRFFFCLFQQENKCLVVVTSVVTPIRPNHHSTIRTVDKNIKYRWHRAVEIRNNFNSEREREIPSNSITDLNIKLLRIFFFNLFSTEIRGDNPRAYACTTTNDVCRENGQTFGCVLRVSMVSLLSSMMVKLKTQ